MKQSLKALKNIYLELFIIIIIKKTIILKTILSLRRIIFQKTNNSLSNLGINN